MPINCLNSTLPKATRIGRLWNPENPVAASIWSLENPVAAKFGMELVRVHARNSDELDQVMATIAGQRLHALIVSADVLFLTFRRKMIEALARSRIPAFYPGTQFVTDGGLMSYAQSDAETYPKAARYVTEILAGAKVGELPIEQATRFELSVNLKTAKALGIKIPQSVLIRANRMIE